MSQAAKGPIPTVNRFHQLAATRHAHGTQSATVPRSAGGRHDLVRPAARHAGHVGRPPIRSGRYAPARGSSGIWRSPTRSFSYTAAGRHWFAHEWLAQTLLGLADRAGGWRGVMLLTAAASGLTAGLMFHLRRFMALLPAVMVLLLGVANLTGSLLARPRVLAWPCLELWCAGLVLARFHGTRPSWWLLPVMIVWVNLHGSFMLGLLLPLVFLVEAAFEAGPRWRRPPPIGRCSYSPHGPARCSTPTASAVCCSRSACLAWPIWIGSVSGSRLISPRFVRWN